MIRNMKEITIEHHKRRVAGKAYLPLGEHYPIIILSHGFNGSGDDFGAQAQTLAENGIGAVTYDFCGGSLRSKSDLKTDEMTVFTEMEDLNAVLDAVISWAGIDKERIFVFGGSMGGLVTSLVAEERADDIRGMALLFPALCVADDWNRRFPNIEDIPEREELWSVPLGRTFFETLHGFSVFERIGNYPGKVLLMHGDKDLVVPVEYSKRVNAIYNNSRLEIFHGEGHGFTSDGNDKVTKLLMEFINVEN